MEIKDIIATIKKEKPNVKSVYYVGCGASQAELYPAKYFLEANAKALRIALYTANEFNYATPKGLNAVSYTHLTLPTTPYV